MINPYEAPAETPVSESPPEQVGWFEVAFAVAALAGLLLIYSPPNLLSGVSIAVVAAVMLASWQLAHHENGTPDP